MRSRCRWSVRLIGFCWPPARQSGGGRQSFARTMVRARRRLRGGWSCFYWIRSGLCGGSEAVRALRF